jgi:DNA-binding transcriptional regulator LsrR (DeoR family)
MPRKPRFRNVGAGKGVKDQLDPDTLARLYLDESLPQSEIARRYGCSPQFISQLVHEYVLVRVRASRQNR